MNPNNLQHLDVYFHASQIHLFNSYLHSCTDFDSCINNTTCTLSNTFHFGERFDVDMLILSVIKSVLLDKEISLLLSTQSTIVDFVNVISDASALLLLLLLLDSIIEVEIILSEAATVEIVEEFSFSLPIVIISRGEIDTEGKAAIPLQLLPILLPLVDNFNAGPPLADEKQFIDDELEIFEPEPDDDNIDPVMVALLQLLSKPVVAIRPLPANVDEFVDAKRLDADVCPVVVPVHCISSDDDIDDLSEEECDVDSVSNNNNYYYFDKHNQKFF
ncbi:hypothetical protein DERP_010816 [Dermatophagoides pteronyssinus]|uniref:Uncharacterized protein n=1 Tax=Dermatophagoides pteronyssinus TaxID=6956 RepID=A0ABQ8J6V1_DERPT|nr:hypothetical protein DERP_010816 [Dermatophagoides pteronyssinus]